MATADERLDRLELELRDLRDRFGHLKDAVSNAQAETPHVAGLERREGSVLVLHLAEQTVMAAKAALASHPEPSTVDGHTKPTEAP